MTLIDRERTPEGVLFLFWKRRKDFTTCFSPGFGIVVHIAAPWGHANADTAAGSALP